MERSKHIKQPDAIFCSDLHLREDIPTCWTGDFQLEQWNAMNFIKNLQEEYSCPVFIAGDIFHHWKASPWLLSMAMEHFPKQAFCIAGQHDLPQHAMNLINKSGLFTLAQAGYVTILDECHWGQEPKEGSYYFKNYDCHLLVWHHLTYLSKPFPDAVGGMAESILRKWNKFSIILTGDNHQSFTIEYQGRRLVNPGSMTRQTADQIDFKPSVYLWFAEDNTVKRILLPIVEGVISREHIDIKEQRDARIDAFVSKLNGEYVAEMSFEDNLESFFKVNSIREPVKEIIYKSLENGKIN